MFYLNATLAALNGYLLYHTPNTFTAVCVGSLIANVLWTSMQLASMKQDLNFDKERLNHLENLSEDKNLQGMMQQLKNVKEHYEKIIESAVKSNGGSGGSTPLRSV